LEAAGIRQEGLRKTTKEGYRSPGTRQAYGLQASIGMDLGIHFVTKMAYAFSHKNLSHIHFG